MRKYRKPALELDMFDLKDVLTASDDDDGDLPPQTPPASGGETEGSAPIALDFN